MLCQILLEKKIPQLLAATELDIPLPPTDGNLRYQSLVPNDRGWLWSQSLELWLGIWEETIERETAVWLRLYDEGQLVLLPEEAAQQELAQAQQQLSQERQQIQELEATLAQYRQRLGEQTE